MRPVRQTITGAAGVVYGDIIQLDITQDNFKVGFDVCLLTSTGGTVTLQQTFDDIQDPDFVAADACWTDNAVFAAIPVAVIDKGVSGNIAFPTVAIRMCLDAGFSGDARFQLVQASGD